LYRSIDFVGNNSFSTSRLRNLMQTTEMNWLSFFKSTDVYDPDKIASDQELIRRFYLKNGYADFRIVGSDVRYNAEGKGYDLVVTVEEGQQYRVGSVNVETQIADLDRKVLASTVKLAVGDVYNGDLVDKSVEAMTREVARKGYAFSSARPRGERDPATGLITLTFVVEEGPRVYIERINVRGNTRTRDYVIRREFPLGEGDAYNRVLVDRAEKRLNGLGYFKKVRITNEPGSSPDRVVLNVDVEDQSTGSFSISGGYSTVDGIIAATASTAARQRASEQHKAHTAD
jgi:outer membrane protein insertion porin family